MASICGRNIEEPAKAPVRIGCGYDTSSVDGLEGLRAVQQLIQDIVAVQVPIDDCNEKRGEDFCSMEAGCKVKTIRRVSKGLRLSAN